MGLHQSRIRHHGRSRNKHANEGPFGPLIPPLPRPTPHRQLKLPQIADKKVEAAIDAALAKETKSPSPEPRMVQAPNSASRLFAKWDVAHSGARATDI